jgi:hypothetical protein
MVVENRLPFVSHVARRIGGERPARPQATHAKIATTLKRTYYFKTIME